MVNLELSILYGYSKDLTYGLIYFLANLKVTNQHIWS